MLNMETNKQINEKLKSMHTNSRVTKCFKTHTRIRKSCQYNHNLLNMIE